MIDLTNEFRAYNKTIIQTIKSVIIAKNGIYYASGNNDQDSKLEYIHEYETSEKLENFFNKSRYEIAYRVASNAGYDEKLLAEISKNHGDHCKDKQLHEEAINQYIKTIGFLEPSYVIRHFINVSQIKFLIRYLEA